jgi:hypothetical protein
VHDAVADGPEITFAGERAARALEVTEDDVDAVLDRGGVDRGLTRVAGSNSVVVNGAIAPDALDHAAREGGLGVHLVEVVLDGRAADVEDEDLHAAILQRLSREGAHRAGEQARRSGPILIGSA